MAILNKAVLGEDIEHCWKADCYLSAIAWRPQLKHSHCVRIVQSLLFLGRTWWGASFWAEPRLKLSLIATQPSLWAELHFCSMSDRRFQYFCHSCLFILFLSWLRAAATPVAHVSAASDWITLDFPASVLIPCHFPSKTISPNYYINSILPHGSCYFCLQLI